MLHGTTRARALITGVLALLLALLLGFGALADDGEDGVLFVPGEASEYGDTGMAWSPDSLPSSDVSLYALDGALPERYDPRGTADYLPAIRHQGSLGTCWAISAAACAQTYGGKNSILSSSVSISPWHLAYFACHRFTDPLGNCSGDYNSDATYLVGGNLYTAVMTLASWRGPADETATNSLYDNISASAALDKDDAFNDELHLENAYLLAAQTDTDRAVIKSFVLENGAATACFYSVNTYYTVTQTTPETETETTTEPPADAAPESTEETSTPTETPTETPTSEESSEEVFETTEEATEEPPATPTPPPAVTQTSACYYQRTATPATGTNHEVTIVGWDDAYPAENFDPDGTYLPAGDGAWLCANTWGDSWGEDGYFWLSYYEPSLLANSCAVYEYGSIHDYDNNYQYDGCVIPGRRSIKNIDSIFYANIFTAGGNTEGGEQLKAVSTYTFGLMVPYTVSVYTDLQDPADPTSGTLAFSASDVFDYTGFHTVPIDPVALWEGETFSVVFEVGRSAEDTLYIPTCYTLASWYSVNDIQDGQSFTSTNGTTWKDGNNPGTNQSAINVRIKAYTSNVGWRVDVKLDPNGGTVASEEILPFFGMPMGSELLTPSRTNWTFLGWFTQAEGGERLTADTVLKSTAGFTLYAHWQSNWRDGMFTDVPAASWYAPHVKYCWENALFFGLTDTQFGPNDNASRGQIVAVLYRLAGSPAVTGDPPFDDVPASLYYARAITWAAANNIAVGSDDDENGIYSFRPNDNVTRQDFMCLLYRYARFAKRDLSPTSDLADFSDAGSIASYALTAERWSVGAGLQVGSDGRLLPRNSIVRCEVAAFLARFCRSE